jgi:hypothetical protein
MQLLSKGSSWTDHSGKVNTVNTRMYTYGRAHKHTAQCEIQKAQVTMTLHHNPCG